VVLGHVVLERAEDDVLLAVDLATGQDDLVVAGDEQALGHQEGIGENLQLFLDEKLRHHEGGSAAVDDDGFAVIAHRGCITGNGALGGSILLRVVLKGLARQRV
jgi:hypothetical protein